MKIAIVYDRINKFGGAERLLLSMHRLFPEAPIFTLVHEPAKSPWAKDIRIIPTFLNKISWLRDKHELLAPVAPLSFETHDFSDYEVIISVTSSDAKAVITKPEQLHVCYCLTPTRYFWSGENEYLADKKLKLLPRFLKDYFRSVDLVTSQRPDHYLSISREVRDRVKKYYNRNSVVIYPPIEDKFYSYKPESMDDRDYYLVVSRLVPYKKVGLIVEAFNKLKKPLIVVGTGSQERLLRKKAKKNITFVGLVDDEKLIEYYRHAKALIFPQEEDFGLVPIEAQALGTPVIAYSKGGALETVIDKKTGLFFNKQTPEAIVEAVKRFEKIKFSVDACVDNASKFNFSAFSKQFSKQISELWQKHREV